MTARKLQTEIDKTLKKIAEGVELFDSIYDKLQQSTNQTQKEKLEQDLKTQIKKLQRLRDQIKTWLQSNDIKDKQPLTDNRKIIETCMERFKACEKEMKTKAFSKEGLSAAAKLDPREQHKQEVAHWLITMVDELSRQVEQTEAELEGLGLAKKKRDPEREARIDELEQLNERRQWHVNRLELILRLLENNNLEADSVTAIKEDISYFVESNAEEDFEEDEGIYDELNLDDEDMFGVHGDDPHSTHDSASMPDDPAPPPPPPPVAKPAPAPVKEEKKAKKEPVAAAAPTAAAPATATSTAPAAKKESTKPAAKETPAKEAPKPAVPAAPAATSSSTSVSTPAPARPAQLPPIRYAAAAAGASATVTSPAPAVTSPSASAQGPSGLAAPSPSKAPSVPEPSSEASFKDAQSAASSPKSPSASLPVALSSQPSIAGVVGAAPGSAPNGVQVASPVSAASAPLPPPSSATEAQPSLSVDAPPSTTSSSARAPAQERGLPNSLADLVNSFESAKQKSMRRDNDMASVNKILDAGLTNIPQPLDADKPKFYVPRNPYTTPSYYPQEPSAQFANPALFAKFDTDTLFYVFYYCQGTYLQYLAASELKKQSWRFHKQYMTWFQRANEPQQITEDYEQGVYLYFDWEGSWCQRRKQEFRFDYKYLETE